MRLSIFRPRPTPLTLTLLVTFFFSLPLISSAQTDQILHSFAGSDGIRPNGALVFDSAGNLYGTAQGGGSSTGCGSRGCGTAFELSPESGGTWSYNVIHTFDGPDGATPAWGVALDAAGNLYGTTASGGANNFGAVFELQPTKSGWTESVLYSFTGVDDGGSPSTGVVLDASGNLYGTTATGAANKQGAVFELSKSGSSWSLKVLLDLNNIDGTGPSPLTFDTAGNLYGTATGGGFDMNHKRGTIFKLSPSSGGTWTSSVLFAFTGPATFGENPAGGVVFDQTGNIYGTLEAGGFGDAFGGSIYELQTPSWEEMDWDTFTRFPASPHPPLSPVALDSSDNIYVALSGDGASVCYGAILKIGKDVFGIYNFNANSSDGHFPLGGIVLDSENNVYGATSSGGGAGYGTIFKVTF
jgi:uncharacterized repeat protein (TIGR03803 family)